MYLNADVRYPKWVVLSKRIHHHDCDDENIYIKRQEEIRKDAECFFRVLQSQWDYYAARVDAGIRRMC